MTAAAHKLDGVLLVEDREDEVEVMLRALERAGLDKSLKILGDGQAALDYLDQAFSADTTTPPPRVILLDLGLPGVSGFEVLKRLRRDPRTRLLPVVVMSSTTRRSEINECYALGANSFVSKRYTDKKPGNYFVQTVRYWLELNDPFVEQS